MRKLVGIAFALPAMLAAQQPVDSARYTVLFSDRPQGHLTLKGTRAEWWADYEFNDRGRGPNVVEHVIAAADGSPRQLTVVGHNYLKDTVDEKFSTDGHTMRWTNSVEGDES